MQYKQSVMKNPSSLHQETIVTPELAGHRLDQALAILFPDHSRSRLQLWVKQGSVTVNGKQWRAKDKVLGGEIIILEASIPNTTTWSAQSVALSIIYEDEHILIINKPVGMVVHPAAGNYENTMANALLHYLPLLAQIPRVGIVHRLDKNTSGLLVVAKSLQAHTALVEQLQRHEVQREYVAIVHGVLISGGTIDAPIGRSPSARQKMAVVKNGKSAITHYRVIERFRAQTLVKVMLETGRTHQIRVHMAHRGYPLLGDAVYGARPMLPTKASQELIDAIRSFKHQALHAKRLSFMHPVLHKNMNFEADISERMSELIQLLKINAE
jgi:23S rRNA pseudouridine1911/1915/1917 synthase